MKDLKGTGWPEFLEIGPSEPENPVTESTNDRARVRRLIGGKQQIRNNTSETLIKAGADERYSRMPPHVKPVRSVERTLTAQSTRGIREFNGMNSDGYAPH